MDCRRQGNSRMGRRRRGRSRCQPVVSLNATPAGNQVLPPSNRRAVEVFLGIHDQGRMRTGAVGALAQGAKRIDHALLPLVPIGPQAERGAAVPGRSAAAARCAVERRRAVIGRARRGAGIGHAGIGKVAVRADVAALPQKS